MLILYLCFFCEINTVTQTDDPCLLSRTQRSERVLKATIPKEREDESGRTFFDRVLHQPPPVVLVVRLKAVTAHLVHLTENIKINKNRISINLFSVLSGNK